MIRIALAIVCACTLFAGEGPDLERMARAVADLPVLHDGRIKPFASVARHCLLSLSGRTIVPLGIRHQLAVRVVGPTGERTLVWDQPRLIESTELNQPELPFPLSLVKYLSNARLRNDGVLEAIPTEQDASRNSIGVTLRLRDGREFSNIAGGAPILLAPGVTFELRRLKEDSSLSATAWLLEGIADRNSATLRPVVKLRNPEVAEAFGLSARTDMRYTPDEIAHGGEQHTAQLNPLFQRDRKTLSPAESQIVDVVTNLNHVFSLIAGGELAVIPGPEYAREQWIPRSLISAPDSLQMEAIAGWTKLIDAVRAGDAASVEQHATTIMQIVAPVVDGPRLRTENFYYRIALFDWSLTLDILALLLLGVGLLGWRTWLWRLAVGSLVIGTVCHVAGIALRVWIQCRPPVATLYESIVFVAAIAAILGIIVELVRRRGDGAFVGAAIATILQLVARGYTEDGDTMGMLVAVLNSNFWLTVHVLTITTGYGCTLVTGVVAHVALSARILYPNDGVLHRAHDRALLGLSLVALLFTLFGTILGGIWADQSWGRFWGWDPKENGALLIVIWLIMMLHLRISGLAGPRGFASGLILGNIVVATAWFGVNLLGIGLHSYGFDNGTFRWLVATAVVESVLAFGLWQTAKIRQTQIAAS